MGFLNGRSPYTSLNLGSKNCKSSPPTRIWISAGDRTLEKKAEYLRREIYQNLTAWQQVLLARHPKRPTTLDYVELIFDVSWSYMGIGITEMILRL